ncbi:putative GTP-binding protein OBGC2 [Hordeum vulgare]|nr:putative GTP-binding protein OBGC2 [Hordeum vulgare]
MHNGFAGETLRIPVPVGTAVRRKKGSVLADLAHPGDEVLVAWGGHGGDDMASPASRASIGFSREPINRPSPSVALRPRS